MALNLARGLQILSYLHFFASVKQLTLYIELKANDLVDLDCGYHSIEIYGSNCFL